MREALKYIPMELDFIHEADNSATMRRNFAADSNRDGARGLSRVHHAARAHDGTGRGHQGHRRRRARARRHRQASRRAEAGRDFLRPGPARRLLPRRPASRQHPRSTRSENRAARLRPGQGFSADVPRRHRAADVFDSHVRIATASSRRSTSSAFARATAIPTRCWRSPTCFSAARSSRRRRTPTRTSSSSSTKSCRARLRANPVVEVPADVLLVGRMMGLLSGLGKSLDSPGRSVHDDHAVRAAPDDGAIDASASRRRREYSGRQVSDYLIEAMSARQATTVD